VLVLPMVMGVVKLILDGLKESVVATVCPVPAIVKCCGVPVALSAMVMMADLLPAAVGMNSKVTVQPTPAASTETGWGQVFPTIAKSPGLVPPSVNELNATVPVPVLVMVNDTGALVEPTLTAAV
jgi:hypothetical protein